MSDTPLFDPDHSSSKKFFESLKNQPLLRWKRSYEKLIAIEEERDQVRWMLPIWKEGLEVVNSEIKAREVCDG